MYVWLIHFAVHYKLTQPCKAPIFQQKLILIKQWVYDEQMNVHKWGLESIRWVRGLKGTEVLRWGNTALGSVSCERNMKWRHYCSILGPEGTVRDLRAKHKGAHQEQSPCVCLEPEARQREERVWTQNLSGLKALGCPGAAWGAVTGAGPAVGWTAEQPHTASCPVATILEFLIILKQGDLFEILLWACNCCPSLQEGRRNRPITFSIHPHPHHLIHSSLYHPLNVCLLCVRCPSEQLFLWSGICVVYKLIVSLLFLW